MSQQTVPAEVAAAQQLLPVLEDQERRLVLERFGPEEAWELGSLTVGLARQRHLPVAVDITCGAQQLFHCALAGASADNDAWIARKRRVVERYGQSSFLVGTRFRARGRDFDRDSRLDVGTYAAHGGSFPLRTRTAPGVVLGALSVSGLPQEEDHALLVEVLERFIAGSGAGAE
jgi:uncharacterized protein (UPF0303 family)